MNGFITHVFVLAVIIVKPSSAQLTNIAGSTSVSLSPTDATCGRTSADSYCRVDLAADASCVVDTCRTVCEERRDPTYRDLMRGVSGFNYDGSVTNATTKDFGGGNVTVAKFNKKTRLAFLRGTVNMMSLDEFTLSFWMRPNDMDTESSVIDILGAGYEERVFNARLGSDLGITIVSGTTSVTRQTWRITRHAWSHVAIQFRQSGVNIFLNGSKASAQAVALQLFKPGDMSNLNLKIGQNFAGDLLARHPVEDLPLLDLNFCKSRWNGWVNYTLDGVRVNCVFGRVSAVDGYHYYDQYPSSCERPDHTELPRSDAHFCQDKFDGWYPQQTGYTRCVEGRQLNLNNCGLKDVAPVYAMQRSMKQCNFCRALCKCDVDCTDGNSEERE
ncbi:hypothetical protein LSAT2_030109 [Lamellibrachia satsuma]|nr:hypothetical protein LSAT2_030109 [Lamellibrachia satsuma]